MFTPKIKRLWQTDENQRSHNRRRSRRFALHSIRRFWTLAAFALLVISCDSGGPVGFEEEVEDESNARITITNNEGSLLSRQADRNIPVPVEPDAGLPSGSPEHSPPRFGPPSDVTLTLVKEISPPTVNGFPVQATSVTIKDGTKAMVSYNMRGAPRMGAIDWITDLKKNGKISASATFIDSDISALSMTGNFVYAAGSAVVESFPFPAVLERLKVQNDKFTLKDNLQVPLTSYVGTSTLVTNNRVYATSGDGGGLLAFDRTTLTLKGQHSLHDARWVAWDQAGGRVVVAQGTPGILAVFAESEAPDGSMTLLSEIDFPGADVAESKSTVEVTGGKAFIAAGPAGVQVICLDDNEIIGSLPRPDPGPLGLDPSVVVTNAVTVDRDLLFISNGEAGIYVARGTEDFGQSGCGQQEITMLGKLGFPDLESANHVDFKDPWLVVAAGLGGVKIVKVE